MSDQYVLGFCVESLDLPGAKSISFFLVLTRKKQMSLVGSRSLTAVFDLSMQEGEWFSSYKAGSELKFNLGCIC